MSLMTNVKLVDNGLIGEDDGSTCLRSTLVWFGWNGCGVTADVRVEWYSRKATAKIIGTISEISRDELETLAVFLFWHCGEEMREIGSDLGQAVCDLESVIRHLLSDREADSLLQQLRTARVAGARLKHPRHESGPFGSRLRAKQLPTRFELEYQDDAD